MMNKTFRAKALQVNQEGVVHKLSNCPRTQTSWTDAKVYGQTHGFVDRLSGRGG